MDLSPLIHLTELSSLLIAVFTGSYLIFNNKGALKYLGVSLTATFLPSLISCIQNYYYNIDAPWLIDINMLFFLTLIYFLYKITLININKVLIIFITIIFTLNTSMSVFNIETNNLWHFLNIFFNFLIYLYLLFFIKEHDKKLKNNFSTIEGKQLRWLKIFIIISLFFEVFWALEDILVLKYSHDNFIFANISVIGTFFTTLYLSINALQQKQIYNTKDSEKEKKGKPY
jgi:hypothetical protein